MTFTDDEMIVVRAGLVQLHTHQVSGGNNADPNLVALIERLTAPTPEAAPEAEVVPAKTRKK